MSTLNARIDRLEPSQAYFFPVQTTLAHDFLHSPNISTTHDLNNMYPFLLSVLAPDLHLSYNTPH